MELINFVNMGTDDRILKSLPVEDCPEELVKAMNKQGLVQKEVTVQGANGKTFTRKQWVKVSDATSNGGQQGGQQQSADLEQKAKHMLNNCDVGDVLGDGPNKISVGRKKNPNTGDWEMTYTVKATGHSVSYKEAVKVLSQASDPKTATLTQPTAAGSARQDFYGTGNFYTIGRSGDFAKDVKFLDSQPDGVTVKIRHADKSETYARKNGKTWVTDTGSKLTSNDVASSVYADDAAAQVNYMVKTKPTANMSSKTQVKSKPQPTKKITDTTSDKKYHQVMSRFGIKGNESIQELKQIQQKAHKEMVNIFKKYQKMVASGDPNAKWAGISAGGQQGFYDDLLEYISEKEKQVSHSTPASVSTSTPSKPQSQNKPTGISFELPTHGDTKKAMSDMLASGKSRDDIMSAAKAAGITWTANDNAGINWMRASMAIQKHMKSGSVKQPAPAQSTSKKPKIFTENGSIRDVTRGGRGGQLMIHRKAASKYIMLQATKKDGSWGKPSRTELYGNETPEDALKRIQGNNPGRQWRFDPDSMED